MSEDSESVTGVCPHSPYETDGGWWCNVCGNPIMAKHYVSRVLLWAETRKMRRAMKEWRNG